MNRRFVLTLLSSPALFASILSMVMMTRPAHASQTVTPTGTHLSCVRSPHSATMNQVCIQVSDNSTPKSQPTIQVAQAQPNDVAELEFTEQESDEAIQLFGCDCPVCINAVRQLHGLAPLPV
ncbi:hypothetical protein B6N60_03121 [Richelia sinica FACHB-800]|uniref:Uncharacterized protein n=1 Tax=Richelia sinica FACHB-800 TaxID=1357546 RepID=A0A975TAK7_9NOST|nr:hypothetical protein [Richelia sinica]MBD2663259.1 hypothetical protein [Richelia sinica FACHB-800]QXE24416.1 hypothetical protein B6N60_03121 [Richelia sinica FACHB-800]